MAGSKMTSPEVCTTQKAAQMLGMSVTSVQQLAEAGVIEAWKTKGGHRRIPLSAIHAYKASISGQESKVGRARGGDRVSLLVIEDNEMQRTVYEKQLSSWDLPLDITFCKNGYQALIEIAQKRPDILLTDIVMDGIDGFEVLNTILGYPELNEIDIAIASALTLEELKKRGPIPTGAVFFGKPVNYDELRGYLRACCAQRARDSRAKD